MAAAKDDTAHELLMRAKDGQDHFDRTFATLCFAALALSLQFSEREQSAWKTTLVIAWALYLVAAILAGWRLMAGPQFERMNWAQLTVQRFVEQRRTDLLNPMFVAALDAGNALDPRTGKSLTLQDAQAGLASEEGNLKLATTNMDALQRKLKWRFNASLVALVVALMLNGFYVAVNFLCPHQ